MQLVLPSASAYMAAWRADSKTEVSRRVTMLVSVHLSMLTGEDRIVPLEDLLKRLAAADPNLLFPMVRSDGCETERRRETVFRVLASLYFLVLFAPLDTQYSPLRVVMVKWKAFGAGGQVLEPHAVFAVKLRTLIQRKLQGDGLFGEQDLRFLVLELMATAGSGLAAPSPLEQCCTSLLAVLAAQHLAAYRTSDALGVVLGRLRRDSGETAFLTMSCFLRRHLVCSPFADAALLDEAASTFRSFHLWPQPFAGIALDMLKMLAMEAKSPGVTWRHTWEAAFPALQGLPSSGRELDTFVFVAPESPLGALLDAVTVAVPSERELTTGAILGLFQCCGIGEEDLPEESEEGAATAELRLDFLSLKKLRGIYTKVRGCLEQAVQMSSAADATFFLFNRLEKLRRAAAKHIAKESARTDGVPGFVANPKSSQMLCGIPFQHHVCRLSFDCALAGRDVGTKWPRRNAQKPLKEIVGELLRAHRDRRVLARCLVEGGDNEMHHMLGAYVALLQADPEVAAKIKFRFYLLPGRRPSMVSSYLCSVDPWYAKTVAWGLRGPVSIAPALADPAPVAPAEALALDEASFRLPPFVLHSMLSDFVTLARHTNRFRVYQCECWQKSVSNTESAPSKYVIPFFVSAEVGIAAQARTFQIFNDLPASLSVADVVACKAFRFKPPVLAVRMVSASLRGTTRPEPELEARPWQELYVGVLPVPAAPCDAPRLSASWMELSAAAAGEPVSGATGQKKRSRTQCRYHVRSVEIEGHNKSTFDVCLDGVAYGPFQKIFLSPCLLGETQVHFPVASFHNLASE